MKLVFTGDLSCTGRFQDVIISDKEIFSKEILSLLESSDYVICNFEGPSSKLDNLYRTDCDVRSPENSINYFYDRNIRLFNLANNHIFDCGVEGFNETKEKIINKKGVFFGAGRNLEEASKIEFLSDKKIKISLIGICHEEGLIANENHPGIFCDIYETEIKNKIQEAKDSSDWVIVNYHGGEEYTRYPMPSRRAKLKLYLDFGADIVVAHHPHVVQGYEQIGEKLIFYSLGNFIFDIPQHRDKMFINEGALLELSFTKNKVTSKFVPIKIDVNYGKITKSNGSLNGALSDFSNYIEKKKKECFRVVCLDEPLRRLKSNSVKVLFKTYPMLILIGNLLKFKRLMIGNNYRPVFFGACIYFIKKIFNKNIQSSD